MINSNFVQGDSSGRSTDTPPQTHTLVVDYNTGTTYCLSQRDRKMFVVTVKPTSDSLSLQLRKPKSDSSYSWLLALPTSSMSLSCGLSVSSVP